MEVTSPEGVFLMGSRGPFPVGDVVREFGLETLDEYLNRARMERERRLRKVKAS